jgi:hypothetical protein
MARHGKKYRAGAEKIEAEKLYGLDEAIALAVESKYAKFDETVEMAVRLGVDPRQADQNVRGTVILPHGTGKTVRVLVIGKGDKVKEAEAAGADFAGGEELTKKIADENWLDFDVVIATPDMMGAVGRLGKVLGSSRPHAQSQSRYSHIRRCQGGARGEGRQGRVPCREGWDRPCADRQGLVWFREIDRKRGRPGGGARACKAGRFERQLSANHVGCDHHGSRRDDRPQCCTRGNGRGVS